MVFGVVKKFLQKSDRNFGAPCTDENMCINMKIDICMDMNMGKVVDMDMTWKWN